MATRTLMLVLTLGLVAGCSGESAGGSTPEEIATMALEASKSEDFAGYTRCVHPEDRPVLTYGTIVGAHMIMQLSGMTEDPSVKAFNDSVQAIFDKYSIEVPENATAKLVSGGPTAQEAKALYGHLDQPKVVNEIMTVVRSTMGKDQKKNLFDEPVTEISVSGDTASGKAGIIPVNFRKHEGRWYISLAAGS